MKSSPQEVDTELLSTHYKSIPFKATALELWDRTVQGKTIGIKMQSMLPQLSLAPHILQVLEVSTREKKVGMCVASKCSPTHYLSLTVSECLWPESGTLPRADYLIYLKASGINRIVDHMSHEDKLLENFMQSMEKIIARHQKIEVLDICRTVIMYAVERNSQKLLLRCEILYPHANLLFSPISSLKLVSSTLTKKLIQLQGCPFLNGFLTMDQNSRVVPLDFEDRLVLQYPVVGIWVKGIPQTNNSVKSINLIHPLVWAACIQYILYTGFKEKVSPNPSTCTFLFIDFSAKPKFYEVTCQKAPAWKTSFFSTELPSESKPTGSLHINFLSQDTRFLLKYAISESLSYTSQSTCNSRSCTPPSSKPPPHRVSTSSSSKNLNLKIKESKSYENIIIEQTRLIEKLQAQVENLQIQIVSPKSRSYCESPSDAEGTNNKRNSETNTSFQGCKVQKLKSTKRIDFADEDINDEMAEDKKKIYSSQIFKKPALEKTMPKIKYESSSDSSEEECIKHLQMKYSSRKLQKRVK